MGSRARLMAAPHAARATEGTEAVPSASRPRRSAPGHDSISRRELVRMACASASGLGTAQYVPGRAGIRRPFRMGFTPWPSEFSLAGLRQAESFLQAHGDLVSIMMIGGLPWQEALDGKPFSADVERQLAYRPPAGHELFLSISPLNMGRDGLAPNWGERDNMPLPAAWRDRRFNSPEVVRALTQFTLRATAAMKPHYLAIGVESNALLSHDRAAWRDYKEMHRAVYAAVKRAHPKLPVFFTTEVNHYLERAREAKGSGQESEVADLMRHSDVCALSYYPHMSYDTVWPVPDDLFAFARTFRKPIAVSETGMLSREVTVTGLRLRGSEADQRQYYDALLRAALHDRYRFVVTFCTTDYEKLLPALPAEAREIANIWTYTGLQTSSGARKPALDIWDRYVKMPLQRVPPSKKEDARWFGCLSQWAGC